MISDRRFDIICGKCWVGFFPPDGNYYGVTATPVAPFIMPHEWPYVQFTSHIGVPSPSLKMSPSWPILKTVSSILARGPAAGLPGTADWEPR